MSTNESVMHEDAHDGHLLHARIRQALPPVSNAEIGRLTGFNTETVRRYCKHDPPSLAFIMRICEIWDLNANWVLFGEGPQHGRDLHTQAVAMISPRPVEGVHVCLLIRVGEADTDAQRAAGVEVMAAKQDGPDSPPVIVVRVPTPTRADGANA